MALQDLTPQLRTRLNRIERAVGLFVTLAALLFIAGFAYYIYHAASRKGWFVTKVEYNTSINSAAGLRPGAPVFLMGFPAGTITRIVPNAPGQWFNVTVYFEIHDPYFGYLWTDSHVKVAAADLLGNRNLEVLKGTDGIPTVLMEGGEVVGVLDRLEAEAEIAKARERHVNAGYAQPEAEDLAIGEVKALAQSDPERFYSPPAKAEPYWLRPLETAAVTERLEYVMDIIESSLPNVLNLTNQIGTALAQMEQALAQTEQTAARAGEVFEQAQPLVDNLSVISDNLRDPDGSLGRWLIPPDLTLQVERTLKSAESALDNTDENLTQFIQNASRTLDNLASLTSNLNAQVQANTNILSEVSSAVVNMDELVRGLQRHWLFRSAFRDHDSQEEPEPRPTRPILPPRLR